MKRLLVFVALVSISQGENNVGSLESILSKVMDVAKDLSSTIANSPRENEYIGCYFDDNTNRMINSKSRLTFNDLTQEWCFAYCRKGNYRYAAVQYSTACFCGDTFNTKAYPKKPESECNMRCAGNSRQICGGPGRNSLFRLY